MGKTTSLIHTYPEQWKNENPGKIALIHNDSGRQLMYHQFAKMVDDVALRLLDIGIEPGDRVAVLLPPCIEGVVLLYACAKIGATYVPFNLQLPKREFIRRIQLVHPKAFFFVGITQKGDCSIVGRTVRQMCPLISHFIQINLKKNGNSYLIHGASSWENFVRSSSTFKLSPSFGHSGRMRKLKKSIHAWSPLVMFFDRVQKRPVLLCHENIMVQANLMHQQAKITQQTKILVNQMFSEMSNLIHSICATIAAGGTVILTEEFDPMRTHQIIDNYCVTHLNQSIGDYELIWDEAPPQTCRHPSLVFAIYQTRAVEKMFQETFLDKMRAFAPSFGTGLHLPEAGGYISFNSMGTFQRNITSELTIHPGIIPLSVREPVKADQTAGEELPEEHPGDIYVHPPAVFLGYFKSPKSTSQILTREGLLATRIKGSIRGSGAQLLVPISGDSRAQSTTKVEYSPLIF